MLRMERNSAARLQERKKEKKKKASNFQHASELCWITVTLMWEQQSRDLWASKEKVKLGPGLARLIFNAVTGSGLC